MKKIGLMVFLILLVACNNNTNVRENDITNIQDLEKLNNIILASEYNFENQYNRKITIELNVYDKAKIVRTEKIVVANEKLNFKVSLLQINDQYIFNYLINDSKAKTNIIEMNSIMKDNKYLNSVGKINPETIKLDKKARYQLYTLFPKQEKNINDNDFDEIKNSSYALELALIID